MFRGKVQTIHFVGIGGIGMSGIAEVLLSTGFTITGSDLSEGASVRRLRSLGARVHVGHDAAHVGTADVVVRSAAVGPSNPEIGEALRRGIPVIARAEMLAELMRLKYGVAIAGSHGKTTTTSMVATAMQAGGLDPTAVIGGRLDSLGGTNARRGVGEYLVAEADESDGSFLSLTPTIALITNIDAEHLDHFGSLARLEDAFAEFGNRIPFYGFVAACFDAPRVLALVPRFRKRVVGYGFSRQADYRATDVVHDGLVSRFLAWRGEEKLGVVSLGVPGRHNVQNAVGAMCIALELGVAFDVVCEAFAGFRGVQRRFTVVGESEGVMWVDDYAHHPVEICATLEAAEVSLPGRRIIAVFQPHRFTRVRDLWDDFRSALHRASIVVVCPIYAAGEAPIDGIDHERLAAGMRESGHRGVIVAGSVANATMEVASMVRPGDVVIAMGAGDVGRLVRDLGGRVS